MRNKMLSLDNFTESVASVDEFKKILSAQTTDTEHKKMVKSLKNIINGELTAKQKQCIALYYGDMKKMSEIAKELGIGISSVSRHIKKAKQKVQKTMTYYYSIN
ncbi:MAG: sigma-70 family RNA polymerase sigma factor [Oscillospiraceae bacterium]|jgi:RNA polymerase sigma factor (sigma-70 family)|nr:sigma-70 family RNA polymerase sigma factor [Oscillospiraceae bacterium]